jgi:hypothetical protein
MTRETALRRMLAGALVEHPSLQGCVFVYEPKEEYPIQVVRRGFAEGYKLFMSRRTGWKEFRNGS